ncbi:serine/threonine protein kinase [Elysia marginata]|uniref:Serine/threonine protein kinase n=1 Tax=Elysia marginata TaxID=1093978 RepID=A0AAV4IJY2_9GAST|nr:serine/threonine protein kinase [Elysia marginata]
MAKMVSKKHNTVIYDLKDEDFFERFSLKREKVLGKGLSGEVILVTSNNGAGQKLAVKTFSLSGDDRKRKMREFTTEVRVMQTVSHHHLVPCLKAGRCHDYAAITMPYYTGGDLLSFDGRQAPKRVMRYMSHVARAVEQLHRQNIAHNDIKLENIFVDASDRAHLGDPGLALILKNGSKTCVAWKMGGTREYWAPERSAADRIVEIDPFKADIYSIGVMFWLLVSGENPGEDTNYLAMFEAASHLNLLHSESKTHSVRGCKDAEVIYRPVFTQLVPVVLFIHSIWDTATAAAAAVAVVAAVVVVVLVAAVVVIVVVVTKVVVVVLVLVVAVVLVVLDYCYHYYHSYYYYFLDVRLKKCSLAAAKGLSSAHEHEANALGPSPPFYRLTRNVMNIFYVY